MWCYRESRGAIREGSQRRLTFGLTYRKLRYWPHEEGGWDQARGTARTHSLAYPRDSKALLSTEHVPDPGVGPRETESPATSPPLGCEEIIAATPVSTEPTG
jgi:hypothetical protein